METNNRQGCSLVRAVLCCALSAVLALNGAPLLAYAQDKTIEDETIARGVDESEAAVPFPEAMPSEEGEQEPDALVDQEAPTEQATSESEYSGERDASEETFEARGTTPIGVEAASIHDANEHAEGGLIVQGGLPAAYDSRDAGFVTAAKRQGDFGTCWAFTTIGALESSLLAHDPTLSASTLDLSERHLAYFMYHQQDDALGNIAGDRTTPVGMRFGRDRLESDPYLVSGGNYYLAAMSLATWAGAAAEDVAPYADLAAVRSEYMGDPTGMYPYTIASAEKGEQFLQAVALDASLARSHNAAWLTGFRMIAARDLEDVKNAIVENGGVSVAVNSNRQFNTVYQDDGNSMSYTYDYSTYEEGEVGADHGVEIIGWDDGFDRLHFGKHSFFATGTDDLPEEEPVVMELDTEQTIPMTRPYDHRWVCFEPEEEGVYCLTGQPTYPGVYRLDASNNKRALAYMTYGEDGSTVFVGMRAGQRYYIYVETDQSGDDVLMSLSRTGDIDYEDVPRQNGAWLVKDSQSCEYGWVSYEDVNVSEGSVGTFYATAAQPYDNIYQYDGGTSTNYNFICSGGSIANVFEARANPGGVEEIKAVGLWISDVNVDYEIQVYLNPTDVGDPTSGTAMLETPATGSTSYMGYYTIELAEPVKIAEGSRYAVVATLSHQDGSDVGYSIDASWEGEWVHWTSTVSAGQSFECDEAGASWDDLSSDVSDELDDPVACARIKAFTNNAPADPVTDLSSATIAPIRGRGYDGTPYEPKPKVTLGGRTLVEGTDFEFSYANNVYASNGKSATLTVTGIGNYTGSKTVCFEVWKNGQPMTAWAMARKAPAASLKSRDVTVEAPIHVAHAVSAGKPLEYRKKGGDSRLNVDVATGRVTVRKGTPAGTYKVTIRAIAFGGANYADGDKVVDCQVQVVAGDKIDQDFQVSAVDVTRTATSLASADYLTRPFSVALAAGGVTYKRAGGSGCLDVDTMGRLKVARGTRAGTYYVKVWATAAGDAGYNPCTRTVTVKVVVK